MIIRYKFAQHRCHSDYSISPVMYSCPFGICGHKNNILYYVRAWHINLHLQNNSDDDVGLKNSLFLGRTRRIIIIILYPASGTSLIIVGFFIKTVNKRLPRGLTKTYTVYVLYCYMYFINTYFILINQLTFLRTYTKQNN